jgi:hypothetical protein
VTYHVFLSHFSALDPSPKDKAVLTGYRSLLFSVILDGLNRWKKLGILDQIINGEQFYKAMEIIQSNHKQKFSDADKEEYLHDSKLVS